MRETGTNLRRNASMALAAIVTVATSLTLVGSALLLKQGVDTATYQWRGGIEFSVFLTANVKDPQLDAVADELNSLKTQGQIKKFLYVDKNETWEEFKVLFANSPTTIENTKREQLPTSYRVVPSNPEQVENLAAQFDNKPGVWKVVSAQDVIKRMLRITNAIQVGILSIALALLSSAVLIIFTTIRTAIFARRREIGIMKLVGATNWFIRVPFMVEGLIQGVIGAGIASSVVWLVWKFADNNVPEDGQQFRQMVPLAGDVYLTWFLLLLGGAILGAAASAVALRRFLRV